MKGRPSSPVKVHVQRSRSLPSSVEMERVALCTSMANQRSSGTKKKPVTPVYKEGESFRKSIPKKGCSEVPSPDGSRMSGDEATLPSGCQRGNRLYSNSCLSHFCLNRNWHSYNDTKDSGLLKILIDAETAAHAVAIQLVSFRDLLADDINNLRFKHSGEHLSRQRNILLRKLDVFKSINKSVREQLKGLRNREENRHETEKQMDILLKKLTQTEAENWKLKRNLSEKEMKVEELMHLRKKEMENIGAAVQLSKSADATRAILQRQLRSKESENNRLCVQLRSLERTMAEQKLESGTVRAEMSARLEKAIREREALKRAARAQKMRAERFEAAMEKCYSQMREKELQLAEASSKVRTWKGQFERACEDKTQLEAQISAFKNQVAGLTNELQKERDTARSSSQELLEKVEKISAENGKLCLENKELKARVADLEEAASRLAAKLEAQNADCQNQRELAEQRRSQVDDLQRELDDMKVKFEHVQGETKATKVEQDARLEKVQAKMESRLKEWEACPELLNGAQLSLQACEAKFLSCKRKCSDKAESLRQLQAKVDSQSEQLMASLGERATMSEESVQLHLKVDVLQRRMEAVQQDNAELVCRLARQDGALQCAGREVDRDFIEGVTLREQLEAALVDVREQVSKVKEVAAEKERSFQDRILVLEKERNRRDTELKQLRQSLKTAEKNYEVRIKDLQLSLEQSESHTHRLQNYVGFLKMTYAAMFENGRAVGFEEACSLK